LTKEEMLQFKDMIAEVVDSKLDEKLDPINLKLEELDKKATRTELKLENETNRAIKVTMEGYAGLNQKMDSVLNVEKRVETLEHKVSVIEFYIKQQQQ